MIVRFYLLKQSKVCIFRAIYLISNLKALLGISTINKYYGNEIDLFITFFIY